MVTIGIDAHKRSHTVVIVDEQGHVRIQFDNFYELARAGRPVASAICVGSVPPEPEQVWTRLRAVGVEIELYERGAAPAASKGSINAYRFTCSVASQTSIRQESLFL
jgi:hypothetical protein